MWLVLIKVCKFEVKWSEVAQLCPTLCDPMDCSLPGSSVPGIFQARMLEWVAISFSNISLKYTPISKTMQKNVNYVSSFYIDYTLKW